VRGLVLVPRKSELNQFLAVHAADAVLHIVRSFSGDRGALRPVRSSLIVRHRRLPVRQLLLLMLRAVDVVAMVTKMASVVIVMMQVAVDERVVSELLRGDVIRLGN